MKKKFLCSLMLVSLLASGACADVIATLSRSNFDVSKKVQVGSDALNTILNAYKKEMLASVLDRDFKIEGMTVKPYDSLTLMQMALSKGDADVFSAPDFVGEYLLRNNPEYVMRGFLIGRNPIALSLGFMEEKKELRDRFNKAIEDMHKDGKIVIFARDFISGPKAANPEPVEFEKFDGAETVTIAVTGDMPPLDYVAADGSPAGFNTAILAEIGRRLRVNVNVINIETGARPAVLKSGRADAVFWIQLFMGEDASEQPDVPEGVIVSAPYYIWNKAMLIGLKKK